MKLKLTVDGKIYEVEVEAPEPEQPRPAYLPPVGQAPAARPAASPGAPTAAPPPSGPAGAVDESKVCRSPISGVVVRVAVQPDQQIQPQEVLLVLEAMKMETVITSPVAGKVAKVHARPGDSVQNGQILIEFA